MSPRKLLLIQNDSKSQTRWTSAIAHTLLYFKKTNFLEDLAVLGLELLHIFEDRRIGLALFGRIKAMPPPP